jgi:hypothetical protein
MPNRLRLTALAAALLGAAACASTPQAPRVAGSTGQAVAAASPSSSGLTPAQRTRAWLGFAACLRSHGANVPDPSFDPDGNPQWPVNPKTGSSQAALVACSSSLQGVSTGRAAAAPTAAELAALTRFAQCIRQHGFPNYPDPNGQTGGPATKDVPDKTDPAYQAALQACRQLLPPSDRSGS